MELLRCLAMLCVVGGHANFPALGVPTPAEAQGEVAASLTRFFFANLCIGAVDVFVLLSGWFGLRPKVRGLCKLLFQVFFCTLGTYAVLVAVGAVPLSGATWRSALLLDDTLWFVWPYVGLYFLSPFINAFLARASRWQVEAFLVPCFIWQCGWGWLTKDVAVFAGGYALFPFVFLYVLARYVRLYHAARVERPRRALWLGGFMGMAVLQTLLSWLIKRWDGPAMWNLYYYTSPTVILMALCLLCYFSRLHFHSRVVNWVGASCFSVYLIQDFRFVEQLYFRPAVRDLYAQLSGPLCLGAIIGFVGAVYVACILIDQLRILFWRVFWRRIGRRVPARWEDILASFPA